MPIIGYSPIDMTPIYAAEKTPRELARELATRSKECWDEHEATPRWRLWKRFWTRYDALRLARVSNLLRLCGG